MDTAVHDIVIAAAATGAGALVQWARGRRKDQATTAQILTNAAAEAVSLTRQDNSDLRSELIAAREELAAARHEIESLRAELVQVVSEVHTLRALVASFETERTQLLEVLARLDPNMSALALKRHTPETPT